MMVPSSDALPELRAWAPEDAKISWRWKEDRFVVKGFGATMHCAGWLDVSHAMPCHAVPCCAVPCRPLPCCAKEPKVRASMLPTLTCMQTVCTYT